MSDEQNSDMDQFLGSLMETHQLDQAYHALGMWAGMMWHFYTRLKAQGFTDDQAMAFARDLFVTQLKQSFGGKA